MGSLDLRMKAFVARRSRDRFLASMPAVAVGADPAAFAAELVAVLTDRQAWERRRRAIDDLAPPDPAIAGRWTDVLDATRHARLPRPEAVTG